MSALNRNPENTNLLQPTKFLLTFSRIETTQYFCQSVNIPTITLGEVDRVTPFLDMYSPGTKLKYDPLDISFIIDEELQSWKNLYDWFISIADPDGFGHGNGWGYPGQRSGLVSKQRPLNVEILLRLIHTSGQLLHLISL